ncbi:MAG: thioredoxin family protein [Candidatus Micrarchaeota archaeon]|nr:thioredoxin family protein [Candidatus Micrarchaeota archaeon]
MAGEKRHHSGKGRNFLEDEFAFKVRDLQIAGGILAVAIIAAAAFMVFAQKPAAASGGPADTVQIVKIIASNCSDCYDLEQVVTAIRNGGTNVTKEDAVEFSSAQGKELISKYGIGKIPSMVVTGAVNSTGAKEAFSQLGEEKQGALVLTKPGPVFIDLKTGEAKGRITVTYVKDSSCADCGDYSQAIQQLKTLGMSITNVTVLEYGSAEAKALIAKYGITNVPTLILSKDAAEYGDFETAWEQIGSVESDGTHVIRTPNPPYLDLKTGSIKGRVTLVTLADSSCTGCYDPVMHKTIFEQMGLVITNESTVELNSSEGRALVQKYNITAAPTTLVSPDAAEYVVLAQVWPQVGTVEPDGWLVFRNMGAIKDAVYRDLATGKIVSASAGNGTGAA